MTLLDGLDSVTVRIARDEQTRRTAYSIRKAVYCDELEWHTEARLVDDADDHSTHFLAGTEGTWVASSRMVMPEHTFVMERYIALDDYRAQGDCVELGRLAVLPRHRSTLVPIAMFRAFYRYAIGQGIRFFCVTGTLDNHLYSRLGFTEVGEPFFNQDVGQVTTPYVLDLDAAPTIWARRRPRMLGYFMQPVEGLG